MKVRSFKYLSPLILYAGAIVSFSAHGWVIWLPLIYSWLIIPGLELFIKPDPTNLDAAEEEMVRNDRFYDILLYLIVPLQFFALYQFLHSMTDATLTWLEVTGRIWVMGLLCGTLGINVGHELGHRSNWWEKLFSRMLLLTSLYMHFFIEHNRGHHKRVATPEDPSSARYGESIYGFYFRSVIFSYLSAWRIANTDRIKRGQSWFSFRNEMINYHVIQIAFVAMIYYFFGPLITAYFLAAALIGILLLETVNYIEHYGLQRKMLHNGKYERAMPAHSWNSDHVIGRVMLFELSRHSDHHYLASRKYQVLRHHENSPQMPTGYPGMMILSLFPPFWFFIMNKKLKRFENEVQPSADRVNDQLPVLQTLKL